MIRLTHSSLSKDVAATVNTLARKRLVDAKDIRSRWSPAQPTVAFDTYWRFAAERQAIFFRRMEQSEGPWTEDPILQRHKFTNVYRVSDRVSQFLIKHVIYEGDSTADELFFRIMLFKLFNKIDTWALLQRECGPIGYTNYSFKEYGSVLSHAMNRGERIYSAAYIMPGGRRFFGHARKHQNHLRLLEAMMKDGVAGTISRATRMADAFDVLVSYPTIGNFLAYQFVTDINYSTLTSFSEMEFVMPGPGASDGIRKCFASLGGVTEPEIILLMAQRQDEEFERLGVQFQRLGNRRLQLIDCQNLFCEVDKYSRLAHPELNTPGRRTRIKQVFRQNPEPIEYWYPPKWDVGDVSQALPE
ncbi:MAG: hypothetical protein HQ567_13830 [Candidatus Nealsonbacteria bacterium]|nr:hypothetical protein [Candidatus Nealsonbacteria bacterium]